MTGHAMPWNKSLSGQQKEDLQNARDLQAKQAEMEKQQEADIANRKKKLNQQQIAMLRSRFGVGGGATSTGAGSTGTSDLQPMSDTSSSLFARITGR